MPKVGNLNGERNKSMKYDYRNIVCVYATRNQLLSHSIWEHGAHFSANKNAKQHSIIYGASLLPFSAV